MKTEQPCPWCGRLVVIVDETRTISHELPECAEFAAVVAAAKPDRRRIEILNTED